MSHTTLAAERRLPPTSGQETLPEYVVPFSRLSLDDISRVGGKNASLGEMVKALAPQGIRIPDGFALTADAFRLHLKEAGLDSAIYAELDHVDIEDVAALASAGRSIRARIADAPLPEPVAAAVETAYNRLSASYEEDAADVAVRSSATAEDLPTASFAGQQETYLNVQGREALDLAIRGCMASLFTDRAIVYRSQHGFVHRDVALSVGVQKMVRSDLGSAG
jgi:pyruvate,water dikinase